MFILGTCAAPKSCAKGNSPWTPLRARAGLDALGVFCAAKRKMFENRLTAQQIRLIKATSDPAALFQTSLDGQFAIGRSRANNLNKYQSRMPNEDGTNQQDSSTPTNSISPFANWCKNVRKQYDDVWWLIIIAVNIISIFCGIAIVIWIFLIPRINEIQKNSVDASKNAVLSQDVLNDISSHIRPYAVIYAKLNSPSATFQYDEGVGAMAESIDFQDGQTNLSGILTFRFKQFVRLPLVRPLSPGIYVHSFWQTNKFDWAFEIRPSATTERFQGIDTTSIEQGLSKEEDYRFFVELVAK